MSHFKVYDDGTDWGLVESFERQETEALSEVCDHQGTEWTITETCECGAVLGQVKGLVWKATP